MDPRSLSFFLALRNLTTRVVHDEFPVILDPDTIPYSMVTNIYDSGSSLIFHPNPPITPQRLWLLMQFLLDSRGNQSLRFTSWLALRAFRLWQCTDTELNPLGLSSSIYDGFLIILRRLKKSSESLSQYNFWLSSILSNIKDDSSLSHLTSHDCILLSITSRSHFVPNKNRQRRWNIWFKTKKSCWWFHWIH
jgi:hypothetical protein